MLTTISMMISIFTPACKHPLSMGLIIITQTILLSIKISSDSSNSWFSYILFITMIGGMMVMFIYMASIASNEKFKMISYQTLFMILITFMISMFVLKLDKSLEMTSMLEFSKETMTEKKELKFNSKFYNSEKKNLTMTLILILMITMVSVTNIASTFEGPLKKTYV